MNTRKDRILKTLFIYLFLILTAASMHAYFIYHKLYFHEICCDSFKQMAHFYPFLQQHFSQGHFFWSWEYGLGGDLFSEFLYYYSTSPFFWITMIFDISSIRDVFQFRLWIDIGKLSLTMGFMYHLLRYQKRSTVSSLIGSMIYGGCLYFTYYSLRFDFMADGFVWLPLLILGYELLVEQQKKGLFIFTVFLITCSNFYLAYISTIYLFLYAVVKYFLHRKTYRLRDFCRYYVKMIFFYLVGVLLSAFAFLPAIIAYLHVDRFYYDLTIPFFFKWDIYKLFPYNFFFFAKTGSFILVFPILVYFLLLCTTVISERQLRIRSLFLGFIFLLALTPLSYSFFNGFSSVQFRWLYLLAFTVAYTSAFVLDYVLKNSGKDRSLPIYLSIFMALLIGMLIGKQYIIQVAVEKRDIAVLCLAIFSFILLLFNHKIPKKVSSVLLIGAVLLNISAMNYGLFRAYLGDPNTLKKGQESLLASYPHPDDVKMFAEIRQSDPTFYRIIWNSVAEDWNAPMVYHYYGFSTYNSLLTGTLHRFFKNEYNTLQDNRPSLFKNVDHRLYLETALAAKYYILPKESHFQTYAYSLFKETSKYRIFKNEVALPIGFLYDKVIDQQTFAQLNFGQRDQLLLRAAVVENQPSLPLPKFDPKQLDVKAIKVNPSDIQYKNATLQGSLLTAGEGAELVMPNPFFKEQGEVLVDIKLKKEDGKKYSLQVNDKSFRYYGDESIYNYPKKEIVFNTGYPQNKKQIVVKITPGQYELKEILLIFNSYKNYPTWSKDRLAQSLQNVQYTEQSVSGRIDAHKDGLLFLSIPYSEGWQVKVDGIPTKKIKVNSAFIGVPITKGTHHVEMVYMTPYLRLGAGISVATLIFLTLYTIISKRKKRHAE
jgi:uncharacterized membrane protein YfhO